LIRYKKNYVVLVTDAAGDPVAGATVVATVTPLHYMKGFYYWPNGATRWAQVFTLQAASTTLPSVPACANEDGMLHNSLYDFNGVLDTDGLGNKEDQNGNNRLDPGNVASVTATPTDAAGHSTLSIVYAKNYAYWVNVKLEAFASAAGSTASAVVTFDLPGLAADYTQTNVDPPGNPSPFGTSTSCFVDLTVTPISTTQMAITWQQSATAAKYNVYRGGVQVNAGDVTLNTYTDTGLTGGTQYCYQIKTVSALGFESVFTDTACATTSATTPAAPANLTVTATSPSQMSLSWTATAGMIGYKIYKGSAYLKSVTGTSAADAGLTANTLYCYSVSGYNATGGESAKSSAACATTQATPPATPTNLAAAGAVLAAGPPKTYQVNLTWTASAGLPAAAVYRIYRDGTLALSVAAPSVAASDTDTALKAQTGYCYTISAVDSAGNESVQSTQICTATPP
jgi:fibronectin type 3 domain-containing protein